MIVRRPSPVRRLTGMLVLLGVSVLAACSSSAGTASPSSSSSTSSLLPLTTTSTAIPGPGTPTSTSAVLTPQSPEQILSALRVRPPTSCTDGRGAVVVEGLAPSAVDLRQLTVIVDGAQASPPITPPTVTGPTVACDGRVHTVLVVAVSPEGGSPSRAFAVAMPA